MIFQQQSVYFEYKHEYIIIITVIYDDIKVVTDVTYMSLRLCVSMSLTSLNSQESSSNSSMHGCAKW